jgi:hypothetical protein
VGAGKFRGHPWYAAKRRLRLASTSLAIAIVSMSGEILPCHLEVGMTGYEPEKRRHDEYLRTALIP